MRATFSLLVVLAVATPAQAVPLALPEDGWLVAPACWWTATLRDPGPYAPGCHVERASIAAVDPHLGGPVGSPTSPGGWMWFTVESTGQVWQEARWAAGWDTESFALPPIQGPTRLTFATEAELRTYDFTITQPEDPPLAHTPEPASLVLLGVSLAALGWTVRRARR